LLADDLQLIIKDSTSYQKYRLTMSSFLKDPYTTEIINQYLLSEVLYKQLMSGGVRSIQSLYSKINELSSSNRDLAKTVRDLNKSSGLRSVIAVGARIAGALFGAATGIGHGAGMGSRIAGGLVGGMLGGSDKIDASLNKCAESFDRTYEAWNSSRDLLFKELMGVVYSIYGGALIRLLDDLNAVGLTLSKIELQNKSLGFSFDIKVSLSIEAQEKFQSWAFETYTKIGEQLDQGKCEIAYVASFNALKYCVQNKPRLQEVDGGSISWALFFQRQFIYSTLGITWKVIDVKFEKDDELQSIKSLLIFWNKAIDQLIFLPDDDDYSPLTYLVLVISDVLGSEASSRESSEVRALAVDLIYILRDRYIERAKHILQDNDTYNSVSGESFNEKFIFLLDFANSIHGNSESKEDSLKSIGKYREIISRKSVDWLYSCRKLAKDSGGDWNSVIGNYLFWKIVKRSAYLVTLALVIFFISFAAYVFVTQN
jgi:hypothetical protein